MNKNKLDIYRDGHWKLTLQLDGQVRAFFYKFPWNDDKFYERITSQICPNYRTQDFT